MVSLIENIPKNYDLALIKTGGYSLNSWGLNMISSGYFFFLMLYAFGTLRITFKESVFS